MVSKAKEKKKAREVKSRGLTPSRCGRCGATFYCMAKNRDKMKSCFCFNYNIHVSDKDTCNGICEACLEVLCGVDKKLRKY